MMDSYPQDSPLRHELVSEAEIAQRLGYARGTVMKWRFPTTERPYFPPFPPAVSRMVQTGAKLWDWPLVAAWFERTIDRHMSPEVLELWRESRAWSA